MKHLKTKKCKLCKKIGKLKIHNNKGKYIFYICDNCMSCYSIKKKKNKEHGTK